MKPKKISAALERAARAVHSSDEFVAHIGNIAERYRRELRLESGPRGQDVRKSLRAFRKNADGLHAWLTTAQAKPSSVELEALAKLGAVMHTAPNQMLASSASILAWLQQASASAAVADSQLAPRKTDPNARRIAADALRATFERHGLKWSTQVSTKSSSPAVQVLCAIAAAAGDKISSQDARTAMLPIAEGTGSKRARK